MSAKHPRSGWFRGWAVVSCAGLVMFLAYGTQYSFGVFLSAMLTELGWSRAGLAGAFSLYSLVYIGLSYFSGRLTDRAGPRLVVSVGGLFLGGGMMLVSRVQAPWQLYAAYGLVAGIGMSAAYVPCNATVVKWFVRRRGLALGITGSGASAGIAALPLVSEALIARLGWRSAYLVFGAAVLVLMNALARFMHRDPEVLGLRPDGDAAPPTRAAAAIEVSWTLREAVRLAPFWSLSSVVVLSLLTIPSAFVHLPQHARDLELGVPRSTFIAIVGAFALAGNLLLGWLSDALGRRGALLSSLLVGTAAFAGFATAESAPGLYAASACFGFYYGTFATLYPAVVGDYFGRRHVGALAGLSFALGSVASAIGPIATGLIADRGGDYASAFLCGTAINAAAVFVFALTRPPAAREVQAA